MNKKRLLGLILFAVLITATLFLSADYLAGQNHVSGNANQSYTKDDITKDDNKAAATPAITSAQAAGEGSQENVSLAQTQTSPTKVPDTVSKEEPGKETASAVDITTEEPWLASNPSDAGASITDSTTEPIVTQAPDSDPASAADTNDTITASIDTSKAPQLIYDSSEVDYKAYIPEMITDSELKTALDIKNPGIDLDAAAAILFDADTKKVLYYKNPVQAMFPASTAKLLTSLVALKWCDAEEQVTIGDEITMIAPDSTRAYLSQGQVLTLHNLLEGMLLPSGNDAAYATAAYVGRKSLNNPEAGKEEAVSEFVRLMNDEAKALGVKNSCFKTPDGYDAIGQYTTAYDMGLIGIAASKNPVITEISQKSNSRNTFVSGEDVTWKNTNKLITRYSGEYYSHAIGLKTGTSTMAGRCLIAAAEKDGKDVVCVIMDSSLEGRWEDAIALLKYGLD